MKKKVICFQCYDLESIMMHDFFAYYLMSSLLNKPKRCFPPFLFRIPAFHCRRSSSVGKAWHSNKCRIRWEILLPQEASNYTDHKKKIPVSRLCEQELDCTELIAFGGETVGYRRFNFLRLRGTVRGKLSSWAPLKSYKGQRVI